MMWLPERPSVQPLPRAPRNLRVKPGCGEKVSHGIVARGARVTEATSVFHGPLSFVDRSWGRVARFPNWWA